MEKLVASFMPNAINIGILNARVAKLYLIALCETHSYTHIARIICLMDLF